MGNRRSRPAPPIYPPNDPLFVEVGCTGLRQGEYTSLRLDAAPFLYFKINTRNYDHLFRVIINILNIINPANATNNKLINSAIQSMLDPSLYTPAYFNQLQREGLTGAVGQTTTSTEQKPFKKPISNINNTTDSRHVFGPIYLLTAFNQSNNFIESYLYFPSMTKDMKPWNNYNTLGMNHAWMYSILYKYRYHPYSSCNIRLGKRLPNNIYNQLNDLKRKNKLKSPQDLVNDINNPKTAVTSSSYITSSQITRAYEHGLKQGCVTKDFENNRCYQSDSVHRGMGIYRDGLNSRAYPSVYFTTYKLNLEDKRIKDLINTNSFTNLQRNVLVEGIDIYPGCSYMLISPNQKYFFSLGDISLILFYNTDAVDLYEFCFNQRTPKNKVPINGKIFQNCKITRASIEGGYLNLYGISDFDEESFEDLLFTLLLTKNLSYAISLVLTDTGELRVMNNNNEILNTINISTGFKSSKTNIKNSNYLYQDRYNLEADYKRRLVNLIMYFKEKGLYRNDPFYGINENTGPTSSLNQNATGIQNERQEYNYRNDIPRFNSTLNYLNRYDQFFNHLRSKYQTDSYKTDIINMDAIRYRPGGNLDKEDTVDILINTVDLDNNKSFESSSLYSGSNAVFKEETPEDRAKRLDDEAKEDKKKYEEQQRKRGEMEDSLFTESTSNVEIPNIAFRNKQKEYNPKYNDMMYSGNYNRNNQLEVRLVELNNYFKDRYPNYIDYFSLNNQEGDDEDDLGGGNMSKKAEVPTIVYNYDSDRNRRLQVLNGT